MSLANNSHDASAASFSNQGLVLMEDQRFADASRSFNKALAILRGRISFLSSRNICRHGSSYCSLRRSDCFDFQDLSRDGATGSTKMLIYEDSLPNETDLKVFDKPIFVQIPDSASCYIYNAQLSFVVLFNSAMAYHLRAKANDCQESLRKALCRYELAYAVVLKEDLDLTTLQIMSLVNNMGEIHFQLGNSQFASRCFEYLAILSSFAKNQCDSSATCMHAVDTIFLPNALISYTKEGVRSAAAA